MRVYFVYRYMVGDEWIYVGKSDNDLTNRINGHKMEAKFAPYNDIATIQFCELYSQEDMEITEKVLIKAMHPKLNTNFASFGRVPFMVDDSFEWKNYSRREAIKAQSSTISLGNFAWDVDFDIDAFLKDLSAKPEYHLYHGPTFQQYKVPYAYVYDLLHIDTPVRSEVILTLLKNLAKERYKDGRIELVIKKSNDLKVFYFDVFVK